MPDVRLYLAPDKFGEPTVWIDVDDTRQPVIRKSSLLVGSRGLWEIVAARLTKGD